jgi:hypothetical protein
MNGNDLNIIRRKSIRGYANKTGVSETGKGKGKGKAVPLQAWSDPEGSRKLRFPDYMTTAQDGSKDVSLTRRPPLPPGKCSWYSFLLEAGWTPGP